MLALPRCDDGLDCEHGQKFRILGCQILWECGNFQRVWLLFEQSVVVLTDDDDGILVDDRWYLVDECYYYYSS